MEDLRKQILQMTGKYDKLVKDVKLLKTKIKKDESTINKLQKEVNLLKQPRSGGQSPVAAPQVVQPAAKQTSSDPLDMFFGGSSTNLNASNEKTASSTNIMNGNNAQSNGNVGGGGGFDSWTTF